MMSFVDYEAVVAMGECTDKEYGKVIDAYGRDYIKGWWIDGGYGSEWEAGHNGWEEGYNY